MRIIPRAFVPTALMMGLGFLPLQAVQANESQTARVEAEQAELLALLSLLEEETAVATQTKLNSDYVPGMVNVLHGEDLMRAGHFSVSEALNAVAGFYSTLGNNGDSKTIVRGVGATLNASNLKLMVNGVAFNRPTDGSADWVLRLPLEQIDRIEVIRGPGSALYGEYAFSGTVNVITRRTNTLMVRGGDDDTGLLAANLHKALDNGGSFTANLARWQNDASGRQTNPDNFAGGGRGFSPQPVYDHQKGTTLFAGFTYRGFKAEGYFANLERGPWYGQNAAMPYELEPRQERVSKLQVQQQWSPSDALDISWRASYQQTELNNATYLPIPAGVPRPGGPGVILTNQYRRDGSEDRELATELSAHWRVSPNHAVFAALGVSDSEVRSAFMTRQAEGGPAIEAPRDALLVLPGASRERISLTLQDQWQVTDRVTLTTGLRIDDYADWGQHRSPRIAAVWQAADNHIFKAQYAEAFRPPTLAERYPGPNSFPGLTTDRALSEESMKSTELAYIYHNGGVKLSVTAFYIDVEDLIEFHLQPGRAPVWRNRGDINTQGIELEWQQSLGRTLDWNANLSFADAEDAYDQDGKLLGSVHWLGNAGVTWHASDRVDHSLHYRYVGTQEGWELNLRSPHADTFAAHDTLNYTLSVKRPFGVNGLNVQAVVKNLFDEDYNSVPTPAQYPQGLPQGGRFLGARLEYQF